MKINAEIEELKGKYYGTKVNLTSPDVEKWSTQIKVWVSDPEWEPSKREVESWGYSKEQWDNNELIDNGWGDKSPIRDCDYLIDGHFESRLGYIIARAIRDTLDNLVVLSDVPAGTEEE